MEIITFPGRAKATEPKQFYSFADLVPTDSDLESRAAELLPRALETIDQFPPEAIAEMLAYAAARLERVGFKVFRP